MGSPGAHTALVALFRYSRSFRISHSPALVTVDLIGVHDEEPIRLSLILRGG